MPDTGSQQPLPFPRRSALNEPPDTRPLAAERAALRQRIQACRRLVAYQGQGSAALAVVIEIQGEQIHALETYIKALEREVRRLSELETPAAPPPKRRRKTSGPTPAQGPCPPRRHAAGDTGTE